MTHHDRDFSSVPPSISDAALIAALRQLARSAFRHGGTPTPIALHALVTAGLAAPDPHTGIVRLTGAGRAELRRAINDGAPGRMPRHASKPISAAPRQQPPAAPAPSVLQWLRQRRDRHGQPMLTQTQLDAGERLAADFVRGQMTPRVTADWSQTGGDAPRRRGVPGFGVEMREGTAAAQDRFRAALAAVEPEFADLLINTCCFDARIEDVEKAQGWPQRSAKVLLQLALNQLARHYGLVARPPAASNIRHSGSVDYKPTLDGY